MLINFPNSLTPEEEQLLKKIAKMKKKVKSFITIVFNIFIYVSNSQILLKPIEKSLHRKESPDERISNRIEPS